MIKTVVEMGQGKTGVEGGKFITPFLGRFNGKVYAAFFPLKENYPVGDDIIEKTNERASSANESVWLTFANVEAIETVERTLAMIKEIMLKEAK